jgi:hypothetical protein
MICLLREHVCLLCQQQGGLCTFQSRSVFSDHVFFENNLESSNRSFFLISVSRSFATLSKSRAPCSQSEQHWLNISSNVALLGISVCTALIVPNTRPNISISWTRLLTSSGAPLTSLQRFRSFIALSMSCKAKDARLTLPETTAKASAISIIARWVGEGIVAEFWECGKERLSYEKTASVELGLRRGFHRFETQPQPQPRRTCPSYIIPFAANAVY